jgi:hypothetical protein
MRTARRKSSRRWVGRLWKVGKVSGIHFQSYNTKVAIPDDPGSGQLNLHIGDVQRRGPKLVAANLPQFRSSGLTSGTESLVKRLGWNAKGVDLQLPECDPDGTY